MNCYVYDEQLNKFVVNPTEVKMTDIILIIDTVLIFIIVLYELLVLLTGKKKRMEYLIKGKYYMTKGLTR